MHRHIPVLESFEERDRFPSESHGAMRIESGCIIVDGEFIHEMPDSTDEAYGFEGGRYADLD